MDFNIEFQISALIMMFVVVIVFYSKKRYRSLENRLYGYMIVVVLFLVASDIASVITLATPDKYPFLTQFFGHAYLVVLQLFIVFMCTYTVAMNIKGRLKDASKMMRFLFWLWPVVGMISIPVSCCLGLYPMGYGRYVYTIGPAVSLSYILGAIAIAFMVVFAMVNRRRIRLRQQLPIYLYALIEGAMTIMQNTNRFLLLSSFATVIVMFIMYFTLENPDLQMIEELNMAKDEAEKASRAKTMFLANMSHEIRTPINTILGMDEMILRESESQDVTEYADNIKRAGKALLAIVNDVLDFSKIESGKMELVESEYHIADSVSDVANLIQIKAEEKGLQFVTDIDSEMPGTLLGDEVRIRQIVTNLLSNAVKYTDQGEIILRIKYTKISENIICLSVSVKDTGRGIREEDMEKLYQSFQRIDESRNRNIEGTGLGLTITQNLLSLMNSELQVQSVYGKGSVFSFEIMQKVVNWEPVGDVKHRMELKETSGRIPLWAPKATVLVTDDNVMNLAVIRGLFKRTGVQLYVASSGQETLTLVREHKFDIVFLDHMMPEMDGIDTYREIRRLWRIGEALMTPKDTPFLVLTANAVAGAREMYLQEGFYDYISKPVDAAHLEKMLHKYLPKDYIESREVSSDFVQEQNTASEPGEENAEMLEYFREMSGQRKTELIHKIEQKDMIGVSLLLRDIRYNVQAIGRTEETGRFVSILKEMEQLASSGAADMLQEQKPMLEEIWKKYEIGVAV